MNIDVQISYGKDFDQSWLDDDVQEARLYASEYTGVMYSSKTGDFAAWYRGRVVGYTSTLLSAESMVQWQLARDFELGLTS